MISRLLRPVAAAAAVDKASNRKGELLMSEIKFPEGFIWGTATSAYQIEGGYNSDGKGESIWDRFTHIEGKIRNNDNGDVACDHYHLYPEDVELMKKLGIKSYRFSIAWTRVFPDGTGEPNEKGIQFYKNLVDLLNKNGITPAVTLYHWDLPQKLQDNGGWANRETAEHFENFARYMFKELGDAVPIWITLNEPWVTSFVGYWYGGHPPAIKDMPTALLAAHNLMLAHGKAVRAFREMGMKGEIGVTLNLNPGYPASESQEDIQAAQRMNEFSNGWFLDPILKGKYPEGLAGLLESKVGMPQISEEDLTIVHSEIDFLGVNYYSGSSVYNDPDNWPFEYSTTGTGKKRTFTNWEIYPEGLCDLLVYLNEEYDGIKIFITENGAAFNDVIGKDGTIEDDDRIDYLKQHISEIYNAINLGVNVAGYYQWSIIDNFEWNSGYSVKFGLVHVDFATQKRSFKKSAMWYKDVISNNGIIQNNREDNVMSDEKKVNEEEFECDECCGAIQDPSASGSSCGGCGSAPKSQPPCGGCGTSRG